MNDIGEIDVLECLTRKQYHKGFIAVSTNVRGGASKPPCVVGGGHGYCVETQRITRCEIPSNQLLKFRVVENVLRSKSDNTAPIKGAIWDIVEM